MFHKMWRLLTEKSNHKQKYYSGGYSPSLFYSWKKNTAKHKELYSSKISVSHEKYDQMNGLIGIISSLIPIGNGSEKGNKEISDVLWIHSR